MSSKVDPTIASPSTSSEDYQVEGIDTLFTSKRGKSHENRGDQASLHEEKSTITPPKSFHEMDPLTSRSTVSRHSNERIKDNIKSAKQSHSKERKMSQECRFYLDRSDIEEFHSPTSS